MWFMLLILINVELCLLFARLKVVQNWIALRVKKKAKFYFIQLFIA